MLFATVAQIVFSIITALAPEFYSFLVFRALLAVAATGEFQTAYIIGKFG